MSAWAQIAAALIALQFVMLGALLVRAIFRKP